MCRSKSGMALLLVLLLTGFLLLAAATLTQVVVAHTQGEMQRQAWQRGRLLAWGGLAVLRYQQDHDGAAAIAALKLPLSEIVESNLGSYISKLKPITGISLSEDEVLLLGYDSETAQALVYVEIYRKDQLETRVWLKQKI